MIKGVIFILLGIFVLYWSQTHSPNAGMGKIISNELSGSYAMGEGWYYFSIVVGTAFAALGAIRIYKSQK